MNINARLINCIDAQMLRVIVIVNVPSISMPMANANANANANTNISISIYIKGIRKIAEHKHNHKDTFFLVNVAVCCSSVLEDVLKVGC